MKELKKDIDRANAMCKSMERSVVLTAIFISKLDEQGLSKGSCNLTEIKTDV
jgi:hypothetical protein